MPVYYLYILKSLTSHQFYIGYSVDPWRRLIEHNTQTYFSTFPSKHKPWRLVAIFKCESKSLAIKAERFIKRQKSKRLLEQLCDPLYVPDGLLAQLVRVPHPE